MECKKCKTFPRRYYIDFWWQGQRLRIFTGKDGHALDSWPRAARLIESMRAQVDAGAFHPKDWQVKPMSFQVYLEGWLKRQAGRQERGDISWGYLQNLTKLARRYLMPFFGKMNIRDIYEATVEDFRENLPASLAPKTVKNILGVLHKILSDACRRRDIPRVPAFEKIQVPEAETKWLTEEEQEKVLTQSPMYRAYFLLLMRRGVRPGEARVLRWEDLHLRKGEWWLTVKAAMDENRYRPTTKEKDVRYFPVPEEVVQILGTFPRPIRGGFIFQIRGRPLSGTRVGKVWRAAAKKVGLKVSCYQGTKHSLGTQMVDRGVSLEILAAIYGHKSTQTTKRYAKVSQKRLKEIWDDRQ